MSLEIEATDEGGALRLDKPLPFGERERVIVTVKSRAGQIRRSAGLIPWKGDTKALDSLLGPDDHAWEKIMTFADLIAGNNRAGCDR